MSTSRQRGASLLMVLLVMVLLLVAFAAAYTLSRVSGRADDSQETVKRLRAAASALEQFAASNGRLPCPASPVLSTGLSDPPVAAKKCNHGDDGTLPWATLGINSDAALDGWGRKISYRVFTGNAGGYGSVTQARGVDLVQCDITDDDGALDANGLCVESTNPHLRSTMRDLALNLARLIVNDQGVPHNDVAFVLISHGATGLGAWTVSAAQLDMPSGDERDNIRETGPFTIRAFSDPDTKASAGTHFDDLLVYASMGDLVKRVGLEAREWPEITPPATTALTLTQASVEAAAGVAVAGSDTQRSTIDFGNARISGFTGTDTATNISYDPNGSGSGSGGIGIVTGSALMSSGAGEWLRVDLASPARVFAVTFDHFGTYAAGAITYTEKVELRFYDGTFTVGSVTLAGCNADGGLASFSNIDPGGFFDSISIVPISATGSPGGSSDSSLLVADLKACDSTSGNCRTTLWSGTNKCD